MSWRCIACDNRGILFAHPLVNEGEGDTVAVVFRCSCEFGRADRRAYRIWTENLEKHYKLEGATPKKQPSAIVRRQPVEPVMVVPKPEPKPLDEDLELPF